MQVDKLSPVVDIDDARTEQSTIGDPAPLSFNLAFQANAKLSHRPNFGFKPRLVLQVAYRTAITGHRVEP